MNRKKLELETEKLKLDKELKRIELEQRVQERGASDFFESLIRRLKSNPIKLEDLEIEVEENDENEEKVVFT